MGYCLSVHFVTPIIMRCFPGSSSLRWTRAIYRLYGRWYCSGTWDCGWRWCQILPKPNRRREMASIQEYLWQHWFKKCYLSIRRHPSRWWSITNAQVETGLIFKENSWISRLREMNAEVDELSCWSNRCKGFLRRLIFAKKLTKRRNNSRRFKQHFIRKSTHPRRAKGKLLILTSNLIYSRFCLSMSS